MGCCNKRNKKAQKLVKTNFTAYNSLDEARKDMNNLINMINIKDETNFNDLNNLIEPEQDNNLFKPGNSNRYEFVFGKDYLYKYKNFLEDYDFIFQISNQLTTTFYTFGFEDVQNIIDDLKSVTIRPPVISNKLFYFVTKKK